MTACLRFAPMIGGHPGELSEEEAGALAEHLGSCEACQARLADEKALSGILSEALLAEANRRDFGTFSDEVLARIPAYREAPALRGGRATAFFEAPPRGFLSPILSWVRHHRLASALAPALAAVALILYLGGDSGPEPALVVVSAEGRRGAMVLETSEGPVVLLGDPEPEPEGS
jgi:hypothetical protein